MALRPLSAPARCYTPEAEALAKELLDYEIKVDQDANEKYGAFKVGAHDDLVTALGLAVQVEPPAPVPWWADAGRNSTSTTGTWAVRRRTS